MDPLRYTRALRRRWYVVVACVVVAVAAAWATTAKAGPTGPDVVTYSAEAQRLSDGSGFGLTTVATIAGTRPVAEIAAETLGGDTTVASLRGQVSISSDDGSGFLYISVFSDRPGDAERIAEAYAAALDAYLVQLLNRSDQTALDEVNEQLDAPPVTKQKIAELETHRDQILRRIDARSSGLIPIGQPVAEEQISGGFQGPQSRTARIGIAALIGLLAGFALVLILERFDTRVRSREVAEERFGMPVLGEIPVMDRANRKKVATAEAPTSSAADAFRLLGAGVGVAAEARLGPDGKPRRGRVVLVTSPGPSEGKTSVVANLAAALAEEGGLIVALSADLRRPQLHRSLGSDPRPGLTQAVAAEGPLELNDYLHYTRVGRVLMAPSGGEARRPGEVLASPAIDSLIEQARERSDWVLIDTSPLLTATESALLLPQADLVLVVVMAGRTSSSLALRTKETLEQLDVPHARVVLNGSKDLAMPSGYRRYYRSSVPAERAGVHTKE